MYIHVLNVWLVFRLLWKLWLSFIVLWEKWTPHFMKNSLIMEEAEAICLTCLISKMIPVQMVAFFYSFQCVCSGDLSNGKLSFYLFLCDLLLSMGLFCLGPNLCLILGGEAGMFSCFEVWCWNWSTGKNFSFSFTLQKFSSSVTLYLNHLRRASTTFSPHQYAIFAFQNGLYWESGGWGLIHIKKKRKKT